MSDTAMRNSLPTTTKEERQKVRAQLKEIYDAYRLASMNCTYYERRLRKVKLKARYFEIGLAVLNSSAVASWFIWKTGIGATAWTWLGFAACICAIVHPLLKLPDEIERLTKQRTGYNDLYHDLRLIVRDIQANQCLRPQDWSAFVAVDQRCKKLSETDDADPSKKVLRGIMKEVITQIPTETLWYPRKPNT